MFSRQTIGEQGGAKGVLPPLEKKIMTPLAQEFVYTPSIQNDPHPLRNGF